MVFIFSLKMSYYSTYRWCAVPECKNTSVKTPDKLWIQVPTDINMRKIWFKLASRDPEVLSEKTRLYFCEDHFDLEHDMENYIRYKIMGSVKRIRLKPHCIPSRFDCNRKHKSASNESHLAEAKRLRISISKDVVQDHNSREDNVKASSSCIAGPEIVPEDEVEMEDEVSKVCRACLASGVRMFDVAAGGLKDIFEHVTGTDLYTTDERPKQVCFVCCSQLQRFRAFCQMSSKAETFMTKLVKKGLQIIEQEVYKRHRLIKPKLKVTKNPLFAIHTLEDPDECALVEVKVEVETEVEDKNISDSETESETETGSEVKTGTYISERDPNSENETEEGLMDLETEGEIKIEIDEIDNEEFDPFEAVEQTTVRDETCYCLQCAEAFPPQSELLKHVQNHTQKKRQANSTRRNVKAIRSKGNVKTKLESQCKFCNVTFAIQTELVTHLATEHGFGEFSEAQKHKRRKPNILKRPS